MKRQYTSALSFKICRLQCIESVDLSFAHPSPLSHRLKHQHSIPWHLPTKEPSSEATQHSSASSPRVNGPPLITLGCLLIGNPPFIAIILKARSLYSRLLGARHARHSSLLTNRGRMFTFQSRAEASPTCRHWLLDPAGCMDQQCRYSHKITGSLSPPSMFACYAYNNGGCPLSQDQCLFAHLLAVPGNQYLQIRRKEELLSHYISPLTWLQIPT